MLLPERTKVPLRGYSNPLIILWIVNERRFNDVFLKKMSVFKLVNQDLE